MVIARIDKDGKLSGLGWLPTAWLVLGGAHLEIASQPGVQWQLLIADYQG